MDKDLIAKAFKEDIPTKDLTTSSLGVKEFHGIATLLAKQDLILSGTDIFEESVHFLDPALSLNWYFKDSNKVLKGQTVAQIEGNLINLIQAERVALNFIGYFSGIATQTNQFVRACKGTATNILDTRKTMPLYRELSKKAVVHGGGKNHRMNLSDAILIKENHIAIAGSLQKAVKKVRDYCDLPIELEVKNLDEVKLAIELNVDHIMLDNMSTADMQAALELVPAGMITEASGNMTLDRIAEVAATGVHYISVGALTHSVKNADLSLLFDWN